MGVVKETRCITVVKRRCGCSRLRLWESGDVGENRAMKGV
jgi:hypothetical protein